jgi:signal transduction histidine kinase
MRPSPSLRLPTLTTPPSIAGSTPQTRLVRTPATATTRPLPRWVATLLRVPLVAKVAGANVLVIVAASTWALAAGWPSTAGAVIAWVVLCLVLLVMNVLLVVTALRPVRTIEETAHRVWSGDLTARVPEMALADRDMARVGRTINLLLDALVSDRARMRELAASVIHAADEERARIGMELHDSAAQRLAALSLQVGAMMREASGTAWEAHMTVVRELAADALEEVRLLAHAVHPRVLQDLGLAAALTQLVRGMQETSAVEIQLDADTSAARTLDAAQTATLYRVAQEAIGNAIRHGAPGTVTVRLHSADDQVTLAIDDDGRGFDVATAEARRPGMGLFVMRQRLALVGGTFDITSRSGVDAQVHGTQVRATIPLPATAGR